MQKLFEDEWGVDESEKDETQITTTMLYFSDPELKEFKKLCKAGIKKEFTNAIADGNISDLLLKVLRKNYADN